MDMMVWDDLDTDIENDSMSLEKPYELSSFMLNTFHSTWHEAKVEKMKRENSLVLRV